MIKTRLFRLYEIASGTAAASIKSDPRSHYEILADLLSQGLPGNPATPAEIEAASNWINNVHLLTHFAQIDIQKRLKAVIENDPGFGLSL